MSTLAGPSPPCCGPSAETPDTVTGSLARVLDHARPPEYGDSGRRIDSCGRLRRSEQDSSRFLGTGPWRAGPAEGSLRLTEGAVMMFDDRVDAGRRLGARLRHLRDEPV